MTTATTTTMPEIVPGVIVSYRLPNGALRKAKVIDVRGDRFNATVHRRRGVLCWGDVEQIEAVWLRTSSPLSKPDWKR